MTVLILSSLDDPHARAVTDALADWPDVVAELLDLSEYPSRMSLSMAFEQSGHRFLLERETGGRLDLSTVRSCWWRRPGAFNLPAAVTDPNHRQLARSEAHTAFRGLYQSLEAFWVNDPRRDTAAAHKPWQLRLAQQIGLEIPPTLMTSDPQAVRDFHARHEGEVVYKQFLALPDAWRETRLLLREDLDRIDTVRLAPVIFQRYVPAVADIRVTIVGQTLFSAAADTRKAAYPVDVRANLDIRYEPHALPTATKSLLLELMRRMGLEYGAIDLRLTPDGRYVFLEINPAGQFLYIEHFTGQKIAAALAAHLARPPSPSSR